MIIDVEEIRRINGVVCCTSDAVKEYELPSVVSISVRGASIVYEKRTRPKGSANLESDFVFSLRIVDFVERRLKDRLDMEIQGSPRGLWGKIKFFNRVKKINKLLNEIAAGDCTVEFKVKYKVLVCND